MAKESMSTGGEAHLRAAVRAFTRLLNGVTPSRRTWRGKVRPPSHVLIIACATSDDIGQSLRLGVYRALGRTGELLDVGIFYSEEMAEADQEALRQYCAAEAERLGEDDAVRLMTKDEFVKTVFSRIAFHVNGLIVGFNLPFEISRLAVRWSKAKSSFYAGGFSLALMDYLDEDGHRRLDRFTPRIAVKPIDSKRSLIGATSVWRGKHDGQPGKPRRRGRFVDARSLTYALTGEDLTLESACATFGVELPPQVPLNKISPSGIYALQREALAIEQLYGRLTRMHSTVAAVITPEQTYSAASVGKGCLRAMGVHLPEITVDPALGMNADQLTGLAMASYFGGRAECRIRRIPVPVTYLDFRSMYPTVNSLMGLWDLLTAEEILAEDATYDTVQLLAETTGDDFFDPKPWRDLFILVEVSPDNDILPLRSKFGRLDKYAYTIGLNYVSSPYPLVYTLADCVASKILTGRAPRVNRAIRFRPVGKQNLRQVNLCGVAVVNPNREDFFRRMVEARYQAKKTDHLSLEDRERLVHFLKDLANSTNYGVFVQLDRQEGESMEVEVHGLGSFYCKTTKPEMPGEYFAPLLATFTTAGARLKLALAESEVTRRGGTYAFMDTDSIAIVSTREGGLISCPGGADRLPERGEAVRALSWAEVQEIIDRFSSLNPYDRSLVPGSILDLEDENFRLGDSGEKERVELMCYVVAAKRYDLHTQQGEELVLRKASEHSLGSYVPPTDPSTGEQVTDWIIDAWLRILRNELRLPQPPEPAWLGQLAVRTMRITTPWMMKWFEQYNLVPETKRARGRSRRRGVVRPFNQFEHVVPARLKGFRSPQARRSPPCLVRPLSPSGTSTERWVDIHDPTGPTYRVVSSQRETVDQTTVVGETYGDLVQNHVLQAEPKSNGSDGKQCGPHTRGLLSRRRIWVSDIVHIGKEANDLELIRAGLISSEDEHLNTYEQDIRDVLPEVLKLIHWRQIVESTGSSRRTAFNWKSGKYRPRKRQLTRLIPLAGRCARDLLEAEGVQNVPSDDKQAIRRLAQHLKDNEAAAPFWPSPSQPIAPQ